MRKSRTVLLDDNLLLNQACLASVWKKKHNEEAVLLPQQNMAMGFFCGGSVLAVANAVVVTLLSSHIPISPNPPAFEEVLGFAIICSFLFSNLTSTLLFLVYAARASQGPGCVSVCLQTIDVSATVKT